MELANVENNDTNVTVDRYISSLYNLTQEDSNWIVTSSFMIFTMQTGNTQNNNFSEMLFFPSDPSYFFPPPIKIEIIITSIKLLFLRYLYASILILLQIL